MNDSIQFLQSLLAEVGEISDDYKKKVEGNGTDFNIFQILGITCNEVRLHSAFLANLLNPDGSHHKGTLFLDEFVNLIKDYGIDCKFETGLPGTRVECEKYIGPVKETSGGRIDLYIENGKGQKIIIENKIYANDQEHQLTRYHNYAPDACLLYLTLDGKEPDKNSISTESGVLKKNEDFFCISYKADILKWLENCYEKKEILPALVAEGINHYIYLVRSLTNQLANKDMEKDIVNKLTEDSKNVEAALAIEKVLAKMKSSIQMKFWKGLKDKLNGYNPYFYKKYENTIKGVEPEAFEDRVTIKGIEPEAFEELVNDYYKSKMNKCLYGIAIDISGDNPDKVKFLIELDWNLYFGCTVCDGDGIIQPEANAKFRTQAEKTSGDKPLWTYWEYFISLNGKKIDFKEFQNPELALIVDKKSNLIDCIAKKCKEQIETRKESVTSGYTGIDRLISGWQPSELIIIASRPSVGKTAFALTMARNMAVDYNIPVALFSLEMSLVQLVRRLLISETGLSSHKTKGGQKLLAERIKDLAEAPLYFDDTPSLSISEFHSKACHMVRNANIKLIIVDYLQLMVVDTKTRGNRAQELASISHSLKAIAKELNIPIIALCQQYGDANDNTQTTQLEAIEQCADTVIFLHRPDYVGLSDNPEDIGKTQLIIAKHENGSTGNVEMRFITSAACFVDADDCDNNLLEWYGKSSIGYEDLNVENVELLKKHLKAIYKDEKEIIN